jgi:hypothetical protein
MLDTKDYKHISKYITTKLQVFINKSLRKILRIIWPDQITNNELWKRTKQPRVDLQIRKRKWGWLGHTLRKPIDDITMQALEWNHKENGVEGGRRTRGEERCLKRLKEYKRYKVKQPTTCTSVFCF